MPIRKRKAQPPGADPHAKRRSVPEPVLQQTIRTTRSQTASARADNKNTKPPVYTRSQLNRVLREPLPNLYEVFRIYNEKYFDNVIRGFAFRWCGQLRSIAGRARTYPHRWISLSKEIHVGRTMKIMVETLLHEMVHAYLFCISDREAMDHGPRFLEVMNDVNARSGLSIAVFDNGGLNHIMHLQTIWQCTNCKEEMVRLRPVRPNDKSVKNHAKTCSGSWVVVE